MSEIDQLIIEFLRLLADQTRLDILKLLKDREMSSAEIREKLNKSHSTISQHLKNLVEKGLIQFNKKPVTIEIDKPKNPGKAEVTKEIKHFSLKDMKIFDVLARIQSYVIEINKEKLRDFSDLGRLDTLL